MRNFVHNFNDILVYTYVNFGNNYLQDSALANYPLWIANWDV